MTHISFGGLLVVAVIALAAPLLVSLAPKARIPADVVAIVAGIIVGPSVLDWVRIDTPAKAGQREQPDVPAIGLTRGALGCCQHG